MQAVPTIGLDIAKSVFQVHGVDAVHKRMLYGPSVPSQCVTVTVPPQVIVLNSCHSAGAKKAFLPPARAVIAMGDSISDLAATAFAAQFYAAVAAGQSLKAAFAQGVVAIEAVSLNEAKTPQLILADGVNAADIVLA